MKILLSNKFYYRRAGAEVYMINLEEILKTKGHDVAVFSMQHPQGLPSPYAKYFPKTVEYGQLDAKQVTLYVTRPFGTREVKRKFNALLDEFQPDVVHFNNMHTQISPVVVQIAKQRKMKTVWTIHDTKTLCPAFCCFRDHQTCELCFTDKRNVLKYRCMKGSLPASIIAYLEAKKWSREKLEKYTDVFLCPSQFMANKLIQGGFNPEKMVTLCNFIDIEKTKRENYNDKEDYFCYIGQLEVEKGVKTLIDAAKQLPYPLKLAGRGSMTDEIQSLENKNIEYLGFQQWDNIKEIVGKARFLVCPSVAYENNPLTVIEAQCLGTPALGAICGGIPELINTGKTGLTFEPGNVADLKEKIEQMYAIDFDFAQIAQESQIRYSAEYYYQELLKIYQS